MALAVMTGRLPGPTGAGHCRWAGRNLGQGGKWAKRLKAPQA